MTAEQKEKNREQASVRVHVEHGIRQVKGFKIARENYRHAIGLFPMVASAVVGLVHLNRILSTASSAEGAVEGEARLPRGGQG
jgi:hypothetical protein